MVKGQFRRMSAFLLGILVAASSCATTICKNVDQPWPARYFGTPPVASPFQEFMYGYRGARRHQTAEQTLNQRVIPAEQLTIEYVYSKGLGCDLLHPPAGCPARDPDGKITDIAHITTRWEYLGEWDTTPANGTDPWRTVWGMYREYYDQYLFTYYYPNLGFPKVGSSIDEPLLLGPCSVGPTAIAFVNGVANTFDAAQQSQQRLRREFGPNRNGVSLQYETFYNQTGCVKGKLACLEDVFEVFEQRSQQSGGELGLGWVHFWEMLAGTWSQDYSWTGLFIKAAAATQQVMAKTFESIAQSMTDVLPVLTRQLLSRPPTAADTQRHIDRLAALEKQKILTVMVAHSQGNLFAVAAIDEFKARNPEQQSWPVVVHVAPASPSLRGEHVLADIDVVINALRVQGRETVPPVNLTLPVSTRDLSGHAFEATYLDPSRAAYPVVRKLITDAIDTL